MYVPQPLVQYREYIDVPPMRCVIHLAYVENCKKVLDRLLLDLVYLDLRLVVKDL